MAPPEGAIPWYGMVPRADEPYQARCFLPSGEDRGSGAGIAVLRSAKLRQGGWAFVSPLQPVLGHGLPHGRGVILDKAAPCSQSNSH